VKNVFEAATHALCVEGHDGVRGVAQQQHAAAVGPRLGAHRAQQPVGICQQLLDGALCAADERKCLQRDEVYVGKERQSEKGK